MVVALVGAYVYYVWRTFKVGGAAMEEVPEKLTLWPARRGEAPGWAVVVQVFVALAVMVAGARFFIDALENGSAAIGVPAGLIALVLGPLATELPEKFNSVIWMREGKDTLALGNMIGAMVFQSTIPVSIGVLLTPWQLDPMSLLSVGLALLSGGLVFALLRRRGALDGSWLLLGGAFYAAFVVAAVVVSVF